MESYMMVSRSSLLTIDHNFESNIFLRKFNYYKSIQNTFEFKIINLFELINSNMAILPFKVLTRSS